jgi:hypothetical protein
VLGDNRDNAADSRFAIGFVPFEKLIGRVERVFWNSQGRPFSGRSPINAPTAGVDVIETDGSAFTGPWQHKVTKGKAMPERQQIPRNADFFAFHAHPAHEIHHQFTLSSVRQWALRQPAEATAGT